MWRYATPARLRANDSALMSCLATSRGSTRTPGNPCPTPLTSPDPEPYAMSSHPESTISCGWTATFNVPHLARRGNPAQRRWELQFSVLCRKHDFKYRAMEARLDKVAKSSGTWEQEFTEARGFALKGRLELVPQRSEPMGCKNLEVRRMAF